MPRGSGGGPRTPQGKARSAQNARRHDLNAPPVRTDAPQGRMGALIAAFAGAADAPAAREAAEARAHLERVRAAKRNALELGVQALERQEYAESAEDPAAAALLFSLDELLVLDGYERKARSRLKRALRRL